jgi:hypothetical protein
MAVAIDDALELIEIEDEQRDGPTARQRGRRRDLPR